MQDAFERLHRGWHQLRQPSSGLAYARSSVLNGCRSVHRRAAVARRHRSQLADPRDIGGPDAASAADDRGEIAAALRRVPRRQREVLVLRYYADLDAAEIAETLRITPSAVRAANGHMASLSRPPISIPGNLAVDDVALSPDGRSLAVTVQSCQGRGCQYSGIRVIALAAGTATTWIARASGARWNVSRPGDSRVAFRWQSGLRHPSSAQQTGYRLLNISAPGRKLLAAMPLGSPGAEPSGYVPQALVTPNGNVVVTSTVQNYHQWYGRDTVVAQIVELSARTGKLIAVLYTVTKKYVAPGDSGAGLLDQECAAA